MVKTKEPDAEESFKGLEDLEKLGRPALGRSKLELVGIQEQWTAAIKEQNFGGNSGNEI